MAQQGVTFVIQALDQATGPLKSVRQQTQMLDRSVKKSGQAFNNYGRQVKASQTPLRKMNRFMGQFGTQAGDMVVQVTGGTDAIKAFGMQAPQLLGFLGPIGAMAGLAAVSFSAYAMAMGDTQKALQGVSALLGQLREPLSGVVDLIKELASAMLPVANFLVNSIDTILIAAGLLLARFIALRVATIVSTAALAAKGTVMQYVALQTALAGRALTTYETIMIGARGAAVALGGVLATVGKIMMRMLPVALLIGVAYLIEAFLQLKRGAGSFGDVMKLVGDIFKAFLARSLDQLNKLGLQMRNVGNGIKAMFFALMKMVAQFIEEQLQNLVTKVNGILAKFNIDPIRNISTSISDAFDSAMTNAQGAIIATNAEIALLDGAIAQSNGKMKAAFQALKQAYKDGKVEIDLAKLSLEDFATGKGAKGLTDMEKRIKSIADGISGSMSDAFNSMIDGTKSFKDAVRDMARSVIKQLIDILVVQQMVHGLMTAMGFSRGPSGDYTKFTNPFGAKAYGGTVSAGKPYLVGERGPEIVVPAKSGGVIPNNQIGGGGTVVVNQTINVSTGVQQTVRNEIRNMLPMISESAKGAVLDAKRRGGSYGRSFA